MSAKAPNVDKDNPLWDFMISTYNKPGVENACLALQASFRADVNMVMFCIWLAYRCDGNPFLSFYLKPALKFSLSWQSAMVEPLRAVRDNLKDYIKNHSLDGPDQESTIELRERIKECELDMEYMQTLSLYALVLEGDHQDFSESSVNCKECARNNLEEYFVSIGARIDPPSEAHVTCILSAVFDA